MPLQFNVLPEHSLQNEDCQFVLGMRLCQALSAIKQCSSKIKNVQLIYSHADPSSRDVVIDLATDGIRLVFDCDEQRLRSIDVHDLSNIILAYGNEAFSTPTEQATIVKVQQSFGATHPGVYDTSSSEYVLQWTGLSFAFATDKQHVSDVDTPYAPGLSSLELPSGPSPKVNRMSIYRSGMAAYPTSALVDVQQVRVISNGVGCVQGLNVIYSTLHSDVRRANLATRNVSEKIYFGDHASTVVAALGTPCRVYYKGDDKMKIHRTSSVSGPTSVSNYADDENTTHYFFNYFTLGMDILFDGHDDRAVKFILHTNYPGHYDFGIYNRCNFELTLDDCSAKSPDSGKASKTKRVVVTPRTTWPELSGIVNSQLMTSSEDKEDQLAQPVRPVVMNRGSTHTNDNPFPVTFCYGYGQCIFEVMTNGCVASVTLFEQESAS